jgi:signal transduction histidine kinase
MRPPAPPVPFSARRRRRSVRWRLAAFYGALSILSAAILVTGIYTWETSAGSIQPAAPAPPAPSGQQSPLAQAQARIGQLEYQVTALSDRAHAINSYGLLAAVVVVLALTAVVSLVAGWLLAGRILRPLRKITAATRSISEDDLSRRLAMPGPGNELTDLADTIDALLARLQAAFDAQRQFVANASHELRTPLTLERAIVEVALADPAATATTLRSTCEEVLAAGQQQERLIEALLTLARSQRGLDHRTPFDLAEITTRVLQARYPRAQDLALSVEAELRPAPAAGDPGLAERLIANLIDNALSYNVPAGQVEVTTGARNGQAFLLVANTGPPVPAGQIRRLFQPFQRLDPDRADQPGGSGLGLSIAAAIAIAHDAALSARPGKHGGLSIEVTFAAPATGHNRPDRNSQPSLASRK